MFATFTKISFVVAGFVLSCLIEVSAAYSQQARSGRGNPNAQQQARQGGNQGAQAQASGTRERHVIREQRVTRDQREINFEEANLLGRRRDPMGRALTQSSANKDFDLIRIRRNWKPEMVQSTSSLEAGRTQ